MIRVVSLMLLLTLLVGACTQSDSAASDAEAVNEEVAAHSDEPIVTVYKSPT